MWIISDLIERRARLLGDLIDRYCHVTTSLDYRSIMPGADKALQGDSLLQRSALFKEKLVATQMSHSARCAPH
jgi:hypothetical protein